MRDTPNVLFLKQLNSFLKDSPEDDDLKPSFLFEEHKKIFLKLPYCSTNERLNFYLQAKQFHGFKYVFIVLWQTRQIKSLFNLKDKRIHKNIHRSHAVYNGDCSCSDSYVGETFRNVQVRIDEHSNPCNDSEPARHLRKNPSHSFSWRILCTAHSFHKRRIIEDLMIQQWGPSLNKQVHSFVAKLLPSGVT